MYTLNQLIGDKYTVGPNAGQDSGKDKGRWTLYESGKASTYVLDTAEDEWEMVI